MRRFSLTLLTVCMTACSVGAETIEAPPVGVTSVAPSSGPVADRDRMEHDVAYTIEHVEAVTAHLNALPDAERDVVRDALGFLVANCPYTRARVMVMLTLDRELSALDAAPSPQAELRIAQIQRAVHAEATFFRETGAAELLPPIPSDYLFATHSVTGVDLAASETPSALAMTALEQVRPAVSAMPEATQQAIGAAWTTVQGYAGPDAVLHLNERHIREALSTAVDTEGGPQVRLRAARQLMEEMSATGC